MQTWALPTLHAPKVFVFQSGLEAKTKRQIVKQVVVEEGVLIVSYDALRIE